MTSPALFFLAKTLISGLIIAAVSTLAKSFPKGAALLTALPLVTFLSLIWIYWEQRDLAVIDKYIFDVFIWSLATTPFFIAAILLFRARVPFLLSMGTATLILFLGVWIFNKVGILK